MHVKRQARDAVLALLSGATAAGANVRAAPSGYPVVRSQLPAIYVDAAVVRQQELDAGGAIGAELQLNIALVADATSPTVAMDALDALEAEVYALLGAAELLPGTLPVEYTGTDAPEIDVAADRPTARQVVSFIMLYRVSRSDHENVV